MIPEGDACRVGRLCDMRHTDPWLMDRHWRTLAELHRLAAAAAPGGETREIDGHVVCTVPDVPDSPWMNVAIPVMPGAKHGRLRQWFAARGLGAFGLWTERGTLIAGAEIEAEPVAMGARLESLDLAGAGGREADLALVGEINDAAYAHLDDRLERTTPRLAGPVSAYELEGSSVALCVTHDGDAGIYYVATRAQARGRGLARAVVKQSLTVALEAGCETSTLQASEDGLAMYEKLGYERLAGLAFWRVGL